MTGSGQCGSLPHLAPARSACSKEAFGLFPMLLRKGEQQSPDFLDRPLLPRWRRRSLRSSVAAAVVDAALPIADKAWPEVVPYNDQNIWAGIANLVGLPADAMPIGARPEGLPIGVQIIGGYLQDRSTIAFAELIEHEFGGFIRRRRPALNSRLARATITSMASMSVVYMAAVGRINCCRRHRLSTFEFELINISSPRLTASGATSWSGEGRFSLSCRSKLAPIGRPMPLSI